MGPQRFYTTEQLSPRMAETPEGFLICYDVPIARTGQYSYKSSEVPVESGPDGVVKIQRDEEDVFDEATIKSFEGKPVTINHPDDFVTPENWSDIAQGHMQNVRRGINEQEDLLIADLVITTEDAIKLVKAGLREVSCGYDAQYEQIKPGLGRQKDITGNHVALVVKGRAGGRCAIMDTACSCCGNCMCGNHSKCKEDESEMKKTKVKDILSQLFPKLKPVLDSVKDEDLEVGGEEDNASVDLQAAQEAAAQAKEAAIQAVAAAKEAHEAVNQATAPVHEQETDEDEEVVENEKTPSDPIATLSAEVQEIKSMLQVLLDALLEDEEGMEETPEEEGTKSLEETNEEQQDSDEEETENLDSDEGLEEEKEDKDKTTDSLWQDTISRAEILAPGIIVTKPKATNLKKVVSSVKRQALSSAMTKDHASIIRPLLGKQKVAHLTGDALDTIFIASSEMVKKMNNIKMQKPSMQMKDLSSYNELAAINAKNKAFWNKK